MVIKHWADSGFGKFLVLSKLGIGRTVKCFEIPYVSFPRPLAVRRYKLLARQFDN